MFYTWADPVTGNRITVTDDGRVIITDNAYGQMIVGLTSVASTGIVAALTGIFPDVPGLPDDAETDPAAQSDQSGA